MGIISKIKKRLPIVGGGRVRRPAPPPTGDDSQSAHPAPPAPKWEEPTSPRGDTPVRQYLEELVGNNEIVLFMKGSPQMPQCGFSANAAGILSTYGKPFAHFDVFLDPEVRQGIKDFSEWPTLPQIYIGGEFIGGSDILQQMHQSGELKQEIAQAFETSAD
ncbi:MAG: Grx4 family monothiol glutaredoxin [Myxococcota bacterium]